MAPIYKVIKYNKLQIRQSGQVFIFRTVSCLKGSALFEKNKRDSLKVKHFLCTSIKSACELKVEYFFIKNAVLIAMMFAADYPKKTSWAFNFLFKSKQKTLLEFSALSDIRKSRCDLKIVF